LPSLQSAPQTVVLKGGAISLPSENRLRKFQRMNRRPSPLHQPHDKDVWIALRLSSYIHQIVLDFRAKNPDAEKLPVVVPVVLAQNATSWEIPTRFSAEPACGRE